MIRLSPKYEEQFRHMLASTATWTKKPDLELTGFWPRTGRLYQKGGLMVIGRAVNGWGEDFKSPDMADANSVDHQVRLLREDGEKSESMEWLRKALNGEDPNYKASRSDFWALVGAIARCLLPTEESRAAWWDHIAWTNLAKVSPSGGGNPPESLWKTHITDMKSLLQMELDEFSPKVVLIVTDYWFDSFRQKNKEDDKFVQWHMFQPDSFVQWAGQRGDQIFLITKRPERKSRELVAGQTIAALQAIQRGPIS